MSSMSTLLQDNFCGKHSCKFIKYSQGYDTVCQLALLGFKGLRLEYCTKTQNAITDYSKKPETSNLTWIVLVIIRHWSVARQHSHGGWQVRGPLIRRETGRVIQI